MENVSLSKKNALFHNKQEKMEEETEKSFFNSTRKNETEKSTSEVII